MRKNVFTGSIIIIVIIITVLVIHYSYQNNCIGDFGNLGDGIGGIASPIVGLFSIYLIYLAYTAQDKNNSVLQRESTRSEINNYFKILSETIDEKRNVKGEDDVAHKIGQFAGGNFNEDKHSPVHTEVFRAMKARATIAIMILKTLSRDTTLGKLEKENFLIIFRTRLGFVKANTESLLNKVDERHLIQTKMPLATRNVLKVFLELYNEVIPE